MAATLFQTDGSTLQITPDNGSTFSLHELYDLLGCNMIQVLNVGEICDTDSILILDEDGKFRQSPVINVKATVIAHAHHAISKYDYIVGDAILCDADMLD